MKTEEIKIAAEQGRIFWRKHALQRLVERQIKQKTVIGVLKEGNCIREYPDDKPYPSGLFSGFDSVKTDETVHVVASYNNENRYVYVISAYKPSLDFFESDFITRKHL